MELPLTLMAGCTQSTIQASEDKYIGFIQARPRSTRHLINEPQGTELGVVLTGVSKTNHPPEIIGSNLLRQVTI